MRGNEKEKEEGRGLKGKGRKGRKREEGGRDG